MSLPEKNHKRSLDQVSKWVTGKFTEARPLSATELADNLVANAVAGWRIPLEGGGHLTLVLDEEFPYSEPRMIIEGRPDLSAGPHIERGGKICITGDSGRIDSLHPVAVVEHVYDEALQLIQDNKAGANNSDFQIDFDAYWRRDRQDERPLQTLIELKGPSRTGRSHFGKRIAISDSEELLRRFLRNTKQITNVALNTAFVIWLEKLPDPSSYPASVDGLRRLVASNSKDGIAVLDNVLSTEIPPIAGIILGPRGRNLPPGLAGVLIDKKPSEKGVGKKVKDPINKGFRPGRVPAAILAQRLQLSRRYIEQLDSAKSRRPSYLRADLFRKKLVCVGCGSLGSGIAKLLLQSGIGEVSLIDPEPLKWANLERHELGSNSINQSKAVALAEELQRKFPLSILKGFANSWQSVYRTNPEVLDEADIIISTCANWNAECALSDLQLSGRFKGPVLYGWLEENALAAHAILLDGKSACLRCGFSVTGELLEKAVRAGGEITASCGGGVSLYGAVDMAPSQAMIAAIALDFLLNTAAAPLHRAWLCPKPNLDAADADWDPDWLSRYGAPPNGGTILPCLWPARENCSCRS